MVGNPSRFCEFYADNEVPIGVHSIYYDEKSKAADLFGSFSRFMVTQVEGWMFAQHKSVKFIEASDENWAWAENNGLKEIWRQQGGKLRALSDGYFLTGNVSKEFSNSEIVQTHPRIFFLSGKVMSASITAHNQSLTKLTSNHLPFDRETCFCVGKEASGGWTY